MNLRTGVSSLHGRLATRVVAGVLLVSLPISAALAVLLTRESSRSLTTAAQSSGQQLARAVALHMEDFISERQETLSEVAAQVSGNPGGTGVADLLARFDTLSHDYSILEVTNLSGQVLAASRPQGTFDPSSQDWFRTAASGQRVVTTPVDSAGVIHWVLATPVLDAAGRPAGVVVGDLDVAQLPTLLNPELQGRGVHAVAVDKNRKLVYDTNMGAVDGPALLAKGALQTTVDNPAVLDAVAGGTGAARFRDGGQAVVAGYDNVSTLGWAIVVEEPAASVLAPVGKGRRLAIVLTAAGALLAVAFAVVFARRTTTPVVALAAAARAVAAGDLTVVVEPAGSVELQSMGEAFNSMVASIGRLIHQIEAASTEVNAGGGGVVGVIRRARRHHHRAERGGHRSVGHHRRTRPRRRPHRRNRRRGRRPTGGDPRQPRTSRSRHHRHPANAPSPWPDGSTTSAPSSP